MARATGVAEASPRSGVRTAGLAVDAPVRARRAPWVLLGVLIVAGGALGFGVWGRSLGDRVEVLAAAADLAPGDRLTTSSFRIVEISGGEGGRFAVPSMIPELTGQVAVGQIPAGTLLNRSMFSTSEPLADGRTIVAAVLSPGEYPTPRLLVGTTVIAIRPAETSAGFTDGNEIGHPITIAEVVTVDALEAGTEPGRLLVGLDVPTEASVEIADAEAADQLRLVIVPAETAERALSEMRAASAAAAVSAATTGDADPDGATGDAGAEDAGAEDAGAEDEG